MIYPSRLYPGATVALIAPSNPLVNRTPPAEALKANFEAALGVQAVWAPHALGDRFYLAGTVEQRVADIHWAFSNPDINAIVCAAGGYGCLDLVDQLDYELIRKHPKVFIGTSDSVTLFNAIVEQAGLVCFHGLDICGSCDVYTQQSAQAVLFAGQTEVYQPNPSWRDLSDWPHTYAGWETWRAGQAKGRLLGVNAYSFFQLANTDYMPNIPGAILVLEDVGQPKKWLHRMLSGFRLHGLFEGLTGLIMGHCSGADVPDVVGNNRPLKDLVLEMTAGYDFPILHIGEIGHNVDNLILPLGAMARMDAEAKHFALLSPAVS